MDELFEQFMIEGRELIAAATDDLLALEDNASATGRIDSAFRSIHTLKGSVAIFDLAPMGVALHAAEDLLGAVRAATKAMDAQVAQSLLGCLDRCDRWMDAVQETGLLPLDAPREAMQIATGLLALTGTSDTSAAPPATAASWLHDLLERSAARLDDERSAGRPLVAVRYRPATDCFFAGDDPMAFVRHVPDLLVLDISPVEPWQPLADVDPYRCNLLIELVTAASLTDVQRLFRFVPDQVEFEPVPAREASGGSGPAVSAEAQRTIRVDSLHIDRLLDLVGELVVTKNGLAHLAARAEAGMEPKAVGAAIRAAQSATDRVVADMHRAVMDVRMVPLDRVFRRLTRMVRELSQRLDRRVTFVVQGEETRVDKAVADALFEPLLHLVRNAVDHGIETGETREQAGKDPHGRLDLRARTVGDQILIEVVDDGAGIDPDRLRAAALERGALTAEQASAIDDAAALQLVFAAGLSTAVDVTDISGRGVGMDAVRSAIERLGGRIALASTVGAGTTVSLRLPATAALTTVLVVRAGEERFAVPLDMVVETLRTPRRSILPVGRGRAFVLRQQTLPLIDLQALLGLGCPSDSPDVRILVVDVGSGPVGIAVDDFSERLDVMLRPMTSLLATLPGVSGTTLLSDGSILLILDLTELIG